MVVSSESFLLWFGPEAKVMSTLSETAVVSSIAVLDVVEESVVVIGRGGEGAGSVLGAMVGGAESVIRGWGCVLVEGVRSRGVGGLVGGTGSVAAGGGRLADAEMLPISVIIEMKLHLSTIIEHNTPPIGIAT